MSHRHGLSFHRGIDVPCSPFSHFGRFGRLFPTLPAYPVRSPDLDDRLADLAESMNEADNPSGDDKKVPAGITFLGQFVDHDITLDVTSSLEQTNDPTAIRNFRTPVLELDSVYGQGPEPNPYLYDQTQEGHLLTGTDDNGDDLPRNRQGRALIGDPRNDENVIISQLHLLFLRFHNEVLDRVEHGDDLGPRYHQNDDFREAQRLVRWHYQWIVLHEFLPAIIEKKVLESVCGPGWAEGHFKIPACRDWQLEPFVPIEFAVAAYRFGHSQVRNRYRLNDQFDKKNQVGLFRQPGETADLTAFGPVDPSVVIRWEHFFDVPGSVGTKPQPSRKIDTRMAEELFQLPFISDPSPLTSLAFRNLARGVSFALPSGEMVARFLGVAPVDTDLSSFGFDQTPLWYYCLREAEEIGGKLGEVGGRIVAETLLGMLHGDPLSYLRLAPTWKPVLPSAKSQEFTMGDLAKLVQG